MATAVVKAEQAEITTCKCGKPVTFEAVPCGCRLACDKCAMKLVRRGEGVGVERTNGQNTNTRGPLSLLRRHAADDPPQAAVPLLAVAALAARRELHRALITREPAAARHRFERHGLAAFAGCDLCLLYLDDGGRHYAPAGSSTCTTPKNQAVTRTAAPQVCLRRVQLLAGGTTVVAGQPLG